MSGLAESLFPRSSKLAGLNPFHPRALLGAGLDVASFPGRAYASLGRMGDESYLDALGRTGPRYVVGQGEGDEMADAILRDPLTPVGFGLGSLLRGARPLVGMAADLGTNAAGMAADQYATTGAVNGGEIGAGTGMGVLLGLGGMAKGGKRSMISPEERAANFRNWFGDSKVVDEAGKPLAVYHTTDANFDTFDPGKLGENTAFNTDAKEAQKLAKAGFWFNSKPLSEETGMSSGSVMPVYIDMKNPYKAKSVLGSLWNRAKNGKQIIPEGYDGVIVSDDEFGGSTSYIVRNPTQIKSATGNRGTFDPNDPNITHFAGTNQAPSRNRATTRLERQAAQVAYDKYGRPREESAARPVSTFRGLGSLLSSPSDTYYTRGGR